MTMLTRFFSTSNVPAAINQVKADPGAASMAARADAGWAQTIGQAFSGLANVVGNAEAAQQKVDRAYLASSNANIEVDYNAALLQIKNSAQPGNDLPNLLAKQLESTALPYVKDAPNDATRQALINNLVGLRANAMKQGQNYQYKVNEDYELGQFEALVNKQLPLAAQGAITEANSIKRLDQFAAGLKEKGYDQNKIEEVLTRSKYGLRTAVALGEADKSPLEVISRVKSGNYQDLPSAAQQQILKRAEESFKGQQTVASRSVDDLYKIVTEGNNVPANAPDVIAAARTFGLDRKADQAELFLRFSDGLRDKAIPELLAQKEELAVMLANNPNPDLDYAKIQNNIIDARIKAIQDDPMQHVLVQGLVPELPPIPETGLNLNDPVVAKAIEARMNAAAIASNVSGVDASPFKNSEIKTLNTMFDKGTIQDQTKYLGLISSFGDKAANTTAAKIFKDNPAAGVAASLYNYGDEGRQNAEMILRGSKAIKNKEVILEAKAEDIASTANAYLEDVFVSDPDQKAQFIEAAKALAAGKSAVQGGGDPIDDTDFLDALKEVTGVIEMNPGIFDGRSSYKTIAPIPGMSYDRFDTAIGLLTDTNLLEFGNGIPQLSNGRSEVNLTADDLDEFEFKPYRMGQYVLVRNNTIVQNENKQPYVIDMKRFIEGTAQQ